MNISTGLALATALVALQIGPLECSAHAEYVLQLMPGGGYPANVRSAVEDYLLRDPEGRSQIEQANQQHRRDNLEAESDQQILDGLNAALVDLNDDGVDELIIQFSPYFCYCGTGGCTVIVYKKVDGRWRTIGGFLDSGFDLTILDQTDGGYHEIRTRGLSRGEEIPFVLKWDGREYH